MKTYYKVVNPELKSCCANPGFPEEYRVQYKLNEWVKPVMPNTRLFIFDSINDAEWFRHRMGLHYKVYPCYAKKVARVKKLAAPMNIVNFWKFKKLHRKIDRYLLTDLPRGTLSCSEVMLKD